MIFWIIKLKAQTITRPKAD